MIIILLSLVTLYIGSSNGAIISGVILSVVIIIIVITIVTILVCIRLHYNKGMSLSMFPPLTRNWVDT